MIKKNDRLHNFRCILSLTQDKTFPNVPACKLDTNYGFPELFLNSDREILHSDTSLLNLTTKRYN